MRIYTRPFCDCFRSHVSGYLASLVLDAVDAYSISPYTGNPGLLLNVRDHQAAERLGVHDFMELYLIAKKLNMVRVSPATTITAKSRSVRVKLEGSRYTDIFKDSLLRDHLPDSVRVNWVFSDDGSLLIQAPDNRSIFVDVLDVHDTNYTAKTNDGVRKFVLTVAAVSNLRQKLLVGRNSFIDAITHARTAQQLFSISPKLFKLADPGLYEKAMQECKSLRTSSPVVAPYVRLAEEVFANSMITEGTDTGEAFSNVWLLVNSVEPIRA